MDKIRTYSIVNQMITWVNPPECIGALLDFEWKNDAAAGSDILISGKEMDTLDSCYGISYLAGEEDGIRQMFFSQKDRKHFLYTCREDYSRMTFCTEGECRQDAFLELFMAGFYSYLSRKGAALLHASAVSYRGAGILFTAASGIGKTTQAELWKQYRQAEILNGDKVFVRREMGGLCIWGSPWKGSSPYGVNQSAPLRAIVVLQQASENSIRRLSGLELLEAVLPHVFLPQWDAECERKVLDFLDQMLQETEVFLLQCRADEEAVELTERALF